MRAASLAVSIGLAASSAWADDVASVGEAELRLFSSRDACRLLVLSEMDDTVLRLPLSGLCTFHRDEDGGLRLVQSDAGEIFLIETSTHLDDGDCRTNVLAVRIENGAYELAPSPATVASCLPFKWDEVMFLGVF